MILQNLQVLPKFQRKHAFSRNVIRDWVAHVEASDWKNFLELKKTFNSADYRKPNIIFDLGGNRFRLVARVDYQKGVVRIFKIGTHDEYNSWKL